MPPPGALYRCRVDISSILFAAGEGLRLRPLTDEAAKPALPLLDVPLGAWGLAALLRAAPPVVVNGSYRAGDLERALRRELPDGWELFDEGAEAYGTGGTVAALSDRVAGPLVVFNGDLLTDIDPGHVLDTHRSAGAGITLAVRMVETGADLRVSGTEVSGFFDRRRTSEEAGAQYLGVAVIEPDVAKRITKTVPLGLGESVFGPLAKRGWLAAHVHDGYALDVGTIDRYVQASIELLNGVAPPPPVPFPGRIVEVDGGRAYLGPHAEADAGSLGPGAVLLTGATVAEGAYVERAVVWNKEVVTPGHEVRDAVWIDDRVVTGPSARREP